MITRRRTLAAIAAAIITPFVSTEAHAAPTQPPGRRPPPKRPPMPYDFTVTQREDMYVPVPLTNPDGTLPDPTAITGAKLSVYDSFGGAQFLVDVALGTGITAALGTDASGNLACLITCHWTPAQSIATRVLTAPLICVGTLNVQASSIITQPDQPLRITIMPATTVGV